MAHVTSRGAVWRLTLMAGACVMTFTATRGQAAAPQIVLPHAPAGAPNVVVVLLDDRLRRRQYLWWRITDPRAG